MPMSQNEVEDLKYAKDLLENPGLAARITDALGTAIDKGFEILPAIRGRTGPLSFLICSQGVSSPVGTEIAGSVNSLRN